MYFDGAYAPFGEPYAQTGTADLSFTGMNQDTVSNLYDFPAREYGIQGRWPSPDPGGMSSVDIRNPQTWNRYAYANNNPLMVTDPTGMYGDATAISALMGGGLFGPSVGAWGQTDLESWGQQVDWEKADLAAAQAAQQATGTSQNGQSAQPTGTSQNGQSAAQSSTQTTSQNSDSQEGGADQFSAVVTNTTMLAAPGAAYSMGANVTYTVFDGSTGLPCFDCAGDPVFEQVNVTYTNVLAQGNGVSFSTSDTLGFAQYFTTVDSNGQFTDPVGRQYSNPFTMTVNYQNLYIKDNNAFYPVASGISYSITATGPYQGSMVGSNGVTMPVP